MMLSMATEIGWLDDAAPAAWWADQLDDSYVFVSALVPRAFEAYCRVIHPFDSRVGELPIPQARALIEVLRGETTTPDRCWFGVSEGRMGMDGESVDARVDRPIGGNRHLLYRGSIDDAIACAPARRLGARIDMRPGLTVEDIAEMMQEESGGSTCHAFHKDATPEQVLESLAEQPHYLAEAAANVWWPDDRAWFLITARDLATTYVGGTRRLIERLQADPHLEVRPAQLSDSLRDAEAHAELVQYGPVIATGAVGEHTWQLRGRIADDGVWSSVDGGGGGGGALPFQDVGWKKLGHFGSVGWGERHGPGAPRTRTLDGVVSKQTAAIDVRLADGTSLPARIIDTGDPRASFFVAVWSAPSRWEALIARDAAGAELETYRLEPRYRDPSQRDVE
jgi:hypothetical protein